MRKIHGFLRLVICVLVLAMLPVCAAFAESSAEMQWTCEDGVLRIACQGDMDLSAGIPWENQKEKIRVVQLESGVTSVGAGAFENCVNLETVALGDTLVRIEENAFRNCGKLHWATLPESMETIEDGAFLGCNVLKTIVIPQKVSSIDQEAFETTTRLRGYSNSAAEDYAKSRGCVFSVCGGTKIPSAEGTWGDLIWTLDKRGTLTLAGTGAAPEGDIPWAQYRSAIKTLKVEEGVTSIAANAFKNCRKLKNVELPESLTEIGEQAFLSCTALKEIHVPASVQKIGDRAFNEILIAELNEDTAADNTAAEETEEELAIKETAEAAVEETEAAVEETEAAVEETEAAVEETEAAVEKTEAAVEETEAVAEEAETAVEETEAVEEKTVAEETDETDSNEKTEAVEDAIVLHLSRENGKTGGAVNIVLSAQNNPGICGLSFNVKYNEDVLSLKGYKCLNQDMSMNDWTTAVDRSSRALWVSSEPTEASGDLLAMTFYISGDAENADEIVKLEDVIVLDSNGNPVEAQIEDGGVSIKAGLLGDVDNDGQVTVSDSLRLKQHLVGIFPREDICNADMNGDGIIDLQDALRLDQFLSGKTDG